MAALKRTYTDAELVEDDVTSYEFIRECKRKFQEDPTNNAIRNAVSLIGIDAATDTDKYHKINHIFLNTVKPNHLKALNQGHSGRCWMFAGLNMIRNNVIKAMGIEDFEFSASYLLFWDKLERCSMFLTQIIDNPDLDDITDRHMMHFVTEAMSDGGYWNFFANLVHKYGLVPAEVMKETGNTGNTGDMNEVLESCLKSYAAMIHEGRGTLDREEMVEMREKAMGQIYEILVKFIGQPPLVDEEFTWYHTIHGEEGIKHQAIGGLTPIAFRDMVLPGIDLRDFVILGNIPNKPLNQVYEIKNSTNIAGGLPTQLANVSIEELKKYTMKTVSRGMPVWFAGDVGKGFDYYFSTLNDQMFDRRVFGENPPMDKGQRVDWKDSEANHAMAIMGYNCDARDKPQQWQVQNSWGFWDEKTPGLDGFLTMDDSWFTDNVFMVAIHKSFLKRNMTKVFSKKPILLEQWDNMAPAIKVSGRYTKPWVYEDKARSLSEMKRRMGMK